MILKNCRKILLIRPHCGLFFRVFSDSEILVVHEQSPASKNFENLDWVLHRDFLTFVSFAEYEVLDQFESFWSRHRRNLTFLAGRQLCKALNHLELKTLAFELYSKAITFLKQHEFDAVVAEENPHLIVDYMLLQVSEVLEIKTCYLEFFASNSIAVCKTNKTYFTVEQMDGAKHSRIELKLRRSHRKQFLYRVLANFAGGGMKWHGDLVDYNQAAVIFQPLLKETLFTSLQHQKEYWIFSFFKMFHKDIVLNDINKRDLLIFLHFQPESSTMPYGGHFSNMLGLAFKLAKKFPKRRVVLKEHPMMLKSNEKKSLTCIYYRSKRWLRYLSKCPNIFWSNEKSEALLEQKAWVVSINGTIIFENERKRGKTLIVNNDRLLNFVSNRVFHWSSAEKRLTRGKNKCVPTYEDQIDVDCLDAEDVSTKLRAIGW